MSKFWIGLVVAVVVLAGGLLAFRYWVQVKTIEPQTQARIANIQKHTPALLADLAALKKNPLFLAMPDGAAGNAAAHMDKHLNARAGQHKTVEGASPPLAQGLTLFPAELKDKEALLKLANASDLSWLHELRAFDHWEMNGHGALAEEKVLVPWSVDLRLFVPLRNDAKLHLLAAQARDEEQKNQPALEPAQEEGLDPAPGGKKRVPAFSQAMEDVQHVARLCISTETLQGMMTGISLLKSAEEARALWHPDLETRFPPEDLERLRRVMTATTAFFSPYVTDEEHENVLKAGAEWPGLCVSATEGAGWFLPSAPLLEDRFPGFGARLEKTLQQGIPGCRLSLARRFLKQFPPATWTGRDAVAFMERSQDPHDLQHESALPFMWRVGLLIPGVEGLVGAILTEISMPQFFGRYERSAK
jgi:hypothetical protein